jgi:hypothetical protein
MDDSIVRGGPSAEDTTRVEEDRLSMSDPQCYLIAL